MYRRFVKKTAENVRLFSSYEVWAAACAAQRINGEYLKDVTHEYDENYNVLRTRIANKVLMRACLMETPELVTEADRAYGKDVRQYWQSKLMDVLCDRATSFVKSAVELAGQEEFRSDNWHGLATVACLPESYKRGLERDNTNMTKMEAQLGSQHFGQVGDKVNGDLEVLESRYSQKWGTWYVTAVIDNNVVLFAYRDELNKGYKSKYAGTIKAHRDNNVTQLNRVRLS